MEHVKEATHVDSVGTREHAARHILARILQFLRPAQSPQQILRGAIAALLGCLASEYSSPPSLGHVATRSAPDILNQMLPSHLPRSSKASHLVNERTHSRVCIEVTATVCNRLV